MSPATPDPRPDFLLGDLEEVEPFVAELIRWEAERQGRKLILVPSASDPPKAVLQALSSVFQNVHAGGYPPLRTTGDPREQQRDVAWQLAYYRRYAYRKEVDYVHFVQNLAQRRCAELFAHGSLRPEHIFVNVRAISNAAAHQAIYQALMRPGDTLLGMGRDRGGRRYEWVSYDVDPRTERLDYDAIRDLARAHRPRVIVAGHAVYPWAPDWEALRAIADEVGAALVADIGHAAGLAAAGVYPNPVGLAHVTVSPTHQALGGPLGAAVMTTDGKLAQAIGRAIPPDGRGGPRPDRFAAMAVAFRIAQTEEFQHLQRQVVANADALAEALQARGLGLAYGGTDTHFLLIDLKSVPSDTGFPLWGEPAARILDLAGIAVSKETLPGDTRATLATGIGLGASWVTGRGLDEADMDRLAGLIHRVLAHIKPFAYNGLTGTLPRGKIAPEVLEEVRRGVIELAEKAGGVPGVRPTPAEEPAAGPIALRVTGWAARPFVQEVVTANVAGLAPGASTTAYLLDRHGRLVDQVVVARKGPDEWGRERYVITPTPQNAARVASWLQALATGDVLFDEEDIFRKVEGPRVEEEQGGKGAGKRGSREAGEQGKTAAELFEGHTERFDLTKPYFTGQGHLGEFAPQVDKQDWHWEEPEIPLMRTPLYEVHKEMGAKIVPFAGWEMPVWYTSVGEEHRAVRETAALFDVAHMGLLEIEGPHAATFLDTVCSNHVARLADGQSLYAYLLDPNGDIIDDVMVYRRRAELYLMVINASNEAKDWDWLNAVNGQRVVIDQDRPWVQVEAQATLVNLKDPAVGERQRRDIALQGPASLRTLQALADDAEVRAALARVRRTNLVECELAGRPVIVARTGYTGEEWGYEILVHPDDLATLWRAILEAGERLGAKPAGLAARDSTRTEAGLPLYGHELAGPFEISPIEAGFPGYVKYHKPFFVGRDALLARENRAGRAREVIRFRLNDKGVRRPHLGDPVVNKKGQLIGHVTSCSIDTEGYLLGLAIVDQRYNVPEKPIAIFPLGGKSLEEALLRGHRVTLPVEATVLRRFPRR